MVKPGYKQTEIGIIPGDWDVVSLNSLAVGGMQNGVFYEVDRKGSGVSFLNVGDLYGETPIRSSSLQKFNATLSEIDRFRINSGDLFFTRSSIVPSGIAYCNWYYGLDEEITVFDSHVVRFKTDLSKVVPMYLYLQCITPSSRKYFIANSKTATMTTIDQAVLGECQIALPSMKEQEIIAQTISDIDCLITNLEKLLAKKKAVKQGAMQDLLSRKRRLPGFDGEWKTMKVEEIVDRFATGLNPRQNFRLNNGGTNYYVTIKNFRDGVLYLDDNCDRIDDAALLRINERSDLRKGDLLFSSIGRIGDAYLITETPTNWNINESVFALRPNIKVVDPLMLFWLLTSEETRRKLVESTTGSTLKSIKLGHLKEIECTFPADISEQKAISVILYDMDVEIRELEKKLEKSRLIKQGMMSELLTGRIRLIDKEGA